MYISVTQENNLSPNETELVAVDWCCLFLLLCFLCLFLCLFVVLVVFVSGREKE